MLSGAPLLLVIVVGWAAVLVPMLLRRHDVSVESRSADRFASAMRILSRRSVPTADRRYVVVPPPPGPARGRLPVEPRDALGAPSPAGRPGRIGARPAASHPRPGRAQLVVRRRRLLLGLATIAVGGLVGGLAVAPAWWWVNAAADLLVVGFVIHLRREAIRARAR
ncbi:MAG: hypothetical protein M3Z02_08075, partial [Actinomycetota bacterium]|nr:hypothetical protein [Actinomycetota bacterium]